MSSSGNRSSLRRGRLVAGACAVAVMTTMIAAPASADVNDQKKKADGKVAATQQNLDDTSAALIKVNNALVQTDKLVAGAQQTLESADTALTTANNHLSDMRSELAIAKADESKNQSALATNEVAQAKSKVLVGGIARQSYMSGGLGNLQLTLNILTSRGDVTSQLSVADMVMRQEGGVLSTLAGEQATATAAGDRLSAARRRIATLAVKATNAQTSAEAAQRSATTARNSLVSLQKTQTKQSNALKKQKKIELTNLAIQQKESDRLAAIIRARNIAAAKAAKRARETAIRQATPPVARSAAGVNSAPQAGGGVLAAPGPISSIVSPFGMRMNPILHINMLHAGDDFPYACGTPVHAAGAGTVASTGWDSAGGNIVLIDHGYIDGTNIASYYAHFERAAIVHTGQHVSKGQLIGYSGTTGRSTGCHLHFGVMANGRWVNPIPYIS